MLDLTSIPSASSGHFWAMNAQRTAKSLPSVHLVFVHRQVVSIHNEVFHVDYDGADVVLSHPQWSLSGVGATLEKAKAELVAEARELVGMLTADIDSLSPSAFDLLQFAQRASR